MRDLVLMVAVCCFSTWIATNQPLTVGGEGSLIDGFESRLWVEKIKLHQPHKGKEMNPQEQSQDLNLEELKIERFADAANWDEEFFESEVFIADFIGFND